MTSSLVICIISLISRYLACRNQSLYSDIIMYSTTQLILLVMVSLKRRCGLIRRIHPNNWCSHLCKCVGHNYTSTLSSLKYSKPGFFANSCLQNVKQDYLFYFIYGFYIHRPIC